MIAQKRNNTKVFTRSADKFYYYPQNFEQNIVGKFSKLSKVGLSVKCFRADFLDFVFNSKHFRDFLEIS